MSKFFGEEAAITKALTFGITNLDFRVQNWLNSKALPGKPSILVYTRAAENDPDGTEQWWIDFLATDCSSGTERSRTIAPTIGPYKPQDLRPIIHRHIIGRK